MIAAWMVYTVLVGALLSAAAWVTERMTRRSGAPTRWIWGFAILLSLAWPLIAGLLPPRDAPPATAIEDVWMLDALLQPVSGVAKPLAERAATWDPMLLGLWIGASALGVALLIWADRRTRRLVRRLPVELMSGVPVRMSLDLGPAVIGWHSGTIVVPAWARELTDAERALIIAHEAHHRRSRDALLLSMAALSVALAPWNPAMWWMARRLRAAVEFDCDARVLRDGATPATYASLLCAIASRHRPRLAAAVALTHPTSLLARRIDHMLKPIVRAHRGKVTLAGAAVCGIIIIACELPTPAVESSATAERIEEGTFSVEGRVIRLRGQTDTSLVYLQEPTRAPLDESAMDRRAIVERALTRLQKGAAGGVLTPRDTTRSYLLPGIVGTVRERSGTRRALVEREWTARQRDGSQIEPLRLHPTVQGDGSPLIFVDGKPASGGLESLGPDRIQRIEIVKGGAAESIYGAKGANGVIRVTTKGAAN